MGDNEVSRKKGVEAESNFKKWLDGHNIPHLHIKQDQDYEALSFILGSRFNAKRPDFILLLPSIGPLVVDVKYRKCKKGEPFFLNIEEVAKYSNLQRWFNLQVWYVIESPYDYQTWFWIPLSKVLLKDREIHKEHWGECYAVPRAEFIEVSSNKSIDSMFSEYFSQELGNERKIT